jgi:hypothetical protein
MTLNMRTYMKVSLLIIRVESFMSISHLKCPLDVQLDISVRQIEGFNGQNDISVRNHLTFVPTVFPAQVTAGW